VDSNTELCCTDNCEYCLSASLPPSCLHALALTDSDKIVELLVGGWVGGWVEVRCLISCTLKLHASQSRHHGESIVVAMWAW
jgi:hypothetical protein